MAQILTMETLRQMRIDAYCRSRVHDFISTKEYEKGNEGIASWHQQECYYYADQAEAAATWMQIAASHQLNNITTNAA